MHTANSYWCLEAMVESPNDANTSYCPFLKYEDSLDTLALPSLTATSASAHYYDAVKCIYVFSITSIHY